ncbi:MAG: flagella synthesis protein FlgN [Steroidobacterales bacterium]
MDQRRRVESLLDSELALAEQLAAVLDAERTALTGVSPDSVSEQAARKVELLTRLEQMEQARRDLCHDSGIALPPVDAAGTVADAVTSRWRSLMDVMARCRSANEVNGYIINVRRNQVQQLIDVVRGTKSLTYGPAGRTYSSAQRELARA